MSVISGLLTSAACEQGMTPNEPDCRPGLRRSSHVAEVIS